MDDRYRDFYRDIYEARTRPDIRRGSRSVYSRLTLSASEADVIRRALEDAETDRVLREDAKALLAVNFQDLVLSPLLSTGLRGEEEPVLSDVYADIVMLARRARASEETSQHQPVVSAHGILDALTSNWDDLRVSSWRLWERA